MNQRSLDPFTLTVQPTWRSLNRKKERDEWTKIYANWIRCRCWFLCFCRFVSGCKCKLVILYSFLSNSHFFFAKHLDWNIVSWMPKNNVHSCQNHLTMKKHAISAFSNSGRYFWLENFLSDKKTDFLRFYEFNFSAKNEDFNYSFSKS